MAALEAEHGGGPESDVELIVIGDGDHLPELRRLAHALGLADRVSFAGQRVPVHALPAMLRTADIGVVPGRSGVYNALAIPTKLLEYVACGVPVIAADHAALRDYFEDDAVGFFPPEDHVALARLLGVLCADTDRRRQMSRRAMRFFDQHSWPRHARLYVDLVAGLAGSRKAPRRSTSTSSPVELDG